MAVIKNLLILFLYHLLLLNQAYSKCPRSFQCGDLGSLEFPLSQAENPGCGLFMVENCDSDNPRIRFEAGSRWYDIVRNESPNSFFIRDPALQELLNDQNRCFSFRDISMPKSPHSSITVLPNLTLFTCFNQPYSPRFKQHFEDYIERNCAPFSMYYHNSTSGGPDPEGTADIEECTKVQLPIRSSTGQTSSDLFNSISAEFVVQWNVSQECHDCHHGGGQCATNTMNGFICKKRGSSTWRLMLGICGGGVALLLCIVIAYIVWQRKKRVNENYFLSSNMSSNLSSKSDIEDGSFYFGIPIFSYTELEKATNSFDPSKELGDGGFGIVYHGKLKDGREVAIKRLYEQNCRRVEQFINEIKILTSLRHPNLVSLYGCTSRRSRELLLVYEYIPNGTVAEHLHGDRAKESPLTWPTRMCVAIETATALAYLHNSDIIHRDVKTNNILLDSNYRVKVADFGLSRLFPTDVTHISTAPQGTPGYVDPEYHQCYQLTDKSDVYSFGVVLIELISSLPAVDITRHRHEINLANLAVNRIQRCAFDELIDSSLGYDSDAEVTRMTTSVAELAFRCLQPDKDLRPSMDEVVNFLKHIQGEEDCNGPEKIPPPETDDGFFKNKNFQSSPTAVIDRWISTGSTTTSSIG